MSPEEGAYIHSCWLVEVVLWIFVTKLRLEHPNTMLIEEFKLISKIERPLIKLGRI